MIILVTGPGSGIGWALSLVLARGNHCVYASMRLATDSGASQATDLRQIAEREAIDLRVIELGVRSDASCRAAVNQLLAERGRIDVVVNNAGMLMTGIAEAFTPEQVVDIFETNAISWLRVNRAPLPAMRRQGRGVLVYVGSTVAQIAEPFLAPCAASKAAGDVLAEAMELELSPFGIETVIVMPGAVTSGTQHFAHAVAPANAAIVAQYGALPRRAKGLGARLKAIDVSNGGSLGVSAVGDAVLQVLAVPHGERPNRIVVDS